MASFFYWKLDLKRKRFSQKNLAPFSKNMWCLLYSPLKVLGGGLAAFFSVQLLIDFFHLKEGEAFFSALKRSFIVASFLWISFRLRECFLRP